MTDSLAPTPSTPDAAARSTAETDGTETDSAGLTPVDRLAIDEAIDSFPLASATSNSVVVLGGNDAFALAVADRFAVPSVRFFADDIASTTPADARIHRVDPGPALFEGASLVVAHLPKSLAELEELTSLAATYGEPEISFVGAGRIKHMTSGMNDVLGRSFTEVSASRGRQKSRALRASSPRRPTRVKPYPRRAMDATLGFEIVAHGAAFAGPRLDLGTRSVIEVLDHALTTARIGPGDGGTALDLGCGTGILATAAALLRPELRVLASDRSWAAVASTRATAAAAGVADRVEVIQESDAVSIAEGSVDIALLNPPFHHGHAIVDDMAESLFRAARRAVRSRGILITVFNSHLRYRPALERLVGPTRQLTRTTKFTVTELDRPLTVGSVRRRAPHPR